MMLKGESLELRREGPESPRRDNAGWEWWGPQQGGGSRREDDVEGGAGRIRKLPGRAGEQCAGEPQEESGLLREHSA